MKTSISPQLAYYYRKGREARRIKHGIKHKAHKAPVSTTIRYNIKQAKPIRLHALGLLWNLTRRIDLSSLPATSLIQVEDWGFGQSAYKKLTYKGYKGRLTATSLTLWLKKPMDLSIGGLGRGEQQAVSQLYAIMEFVAQRLNLSPITETAEIAQEHIAFTGDPGAEQAVAEHRLIKVRDPKDGKVRFLVDVSTGLPESEFVHSAHSGNDSRLYEQMVMDVVGGRWSVDKQLELNAGLLKGQAYEQQFAKSHNDLVKENVRTIKELRELLTELRAERRQRRL